MQFTIYTVQLEDIIKWRMVARFKYSRGQSGWWGGATRVALPSPNSIGLYGKSYWCWPEHVDSFCVQFWKIDLAILQKYYVLTLESYAYLNYNLFSNKGHFSQMQSLFTNKLLVTAPLGSSGWMALHSYFLEDRQAADQHKIGILYVNDDNLLYLEIDEHEHTWMILHFKAQPFFVFKEMS